ncbi:site-specific DNA-methyltransferase [Streptobacillus ratti]|uniref:site-specific DNA-methyltransferase n=1 Tax=Streptobacillus ratti TaxID=1720557 RepID=UPI0009337ECE|nr:site-specific DNA-methyltransferase [Streptobacillus ratti]
MSNLSKIKREKMLKYLEKLKKINNNDENIRAITEIETVINEKKYGLVWEEHSEKVDEMLKHNVPIFVEEKERKITVNEDETYNFLLEGDNLHSLKLLEKTHKGKIDVIYIDPPYNTGNKDFIYDDSFVDKTDGYSHSKWLSFMEKRLDIARELLSEDGVIFISIDDNEQAQLKLLCDEIFGEDNLISIICVELSKTQGMKVKSAQDGRIVKNHEYVYLYCKNIEKAFNNRMPLYDKTDIWDSHFNKIILKGIDNYNIFSINDYIKSEFNDVYKIFKDHGLLEKNKITEKSIRNGILLSSKLQEFFYKEISDKIFQEMACSVNIPDDINNLLNESVIVEYEKYLLTKTSTGKIRQYRPLNENIKLSDEYNRRVERVTIRGALWKGFYSDMMNVQKEGIIDFKNGKKPVRLISQLNKWANRKKSVVLDFFAGSGTTGHAIMQLNKEDGGNRTYILCTNNENNICEEVTYQRLKNIQTELPHNLKYYKTEFIPKFFDDEESISDKMMEHIKELIELEHAIELDSKKYIVLNHEDEIDGAILKIQNDGKIFMCSGLFLSRSNQRILEEKRVSIIEIPEYYFREELREVGEL